MSERLPAAADEACASHHGPVFANQLRGGREERIGAAYVAAGSVLGGRVIARSSLLPGAATFPRSFFASDRLDLGPALDHFKTALDVSRRIRSGLRPGHCGRAGRVRVGPRHSELAGCLAGSDLMTGQVDPSAQALTDCESEQLHLSGRIQAHGALVAADLQDRRITYASANTSELIGAEPDQLFDSPVLSIFSPMNSSGLSRRSSRLATAFVARSVWNALAAGFDGKVDVILHQSVGRSSSRSRGARDDQANLVPVL